MPVLNVIEFKKKVVLIEVSHFKIIFFSNKDLNLASSFIRLLYFDFMILQIAINCLYSLFAASIISVLLSRLKRSGCNPNAFESQKLRRSERSSPLINDPPLTILTVAL